MPQTYSYYRVYINPEPWVVPPFSAIPKGKRYIPVAGKDHRGENVKAAIRETLTALDAPMHEPPYRIHLEFHRQLEQYVTESGRNNTRNKADATNMQKLTEDALEGTLIHNDVDTACITGHIIEQSKETVPFIDIMVIGEWVPVDTRPPEFANESPTALFTPSSTNEW